jgi:predicted acetyltransferase
MDLTKLTLMRLSPAYQAACDDFVQEFISAGETDYGWVHEYQRYSFPEYLAFLRAGESGEYKPENYVPQTVFWLSTPQGQLLAVSRLRHRLNPGLEIEGGHIGYAVRPSARRQGLATHLLSLVLVQARLIGLTRVLVTCDHDNTGSARTIEKNGGVLDDLRVSPDSGKLIKRYWIALV